MSYPIQRKEFLTSEKVMPEELICIFFPSTRGYFIPVEQEENKLFTVLQRVNAFFPEMFMAALPLPLPLRRWRLGSGSLFYLTVAARRGSGNLFILPSQRGAIAGEFLESFLLFLSKKPIML
jgi:hypothetical protein